MYIYHSPLNLIIKDFIFKTQSFSFTFYFYCIIQCLFQYDFTADIGNCTSVMCFSKIL